MNVLDREFSKKFDVVYKATVEAGKLIHFRPMSQHPNIYFHQYNGLTETCKENENRVIVYLNENLDDKEMEHVTAHELCHIIINEKGFLFQYRINKTKLYNVLLKNLGKKQAQLMFDGMHNKMITRFAFIKSSFTDIIADIYMKKYNYAMNTETQSKINRIKKDIIELDLKDKEKTFLNAIVYVSLIFRKKYSCSIIEPSDIEKVYRKYNRQPILRIARNILSKLPSGSLLEPKEFYDILKKMRNLYIQTIGIPLKKTIIELRNPWTSETE